jgi:DNA-binding transcriptional regulator YdaS (Cro superfamily)
MSLPAEQRSLRAAAKLLGLSHAHLSRYERGERRIAPLRAARIEKITGIPREVLRPDVFGEVSE